MANLLKDYEVRMIPEETPGTTPAGAMQLMVFDSFSPDGDGPERVATGGVSPDQQVYDNAPTTTATSISVEAPSFYDHYKLMQAAVLGQAGHSAAVTVTGSDISAVVSGNKLLKGAGTWGALAQYDIVEVRGLTTNGAAFLAMVSGTPTATDLPLDADWKTLQAEAAGAAVTVEYRGRLRYGSLLQTFSVELWHTKGGYGWVYSNVGVGDWTWGFDIPNAPKNSFTLTCGRVPEKITTRLANATTAAPTDRSVHSSTIHFGRQAAPDWGGQFRYNGTVYDPTELRIKKFEWKSPRTLNTSGGAGAFGPLSLSSDGLIEAMVTLEVFRDSAAAEVLLADRQDLDAVVSIAHGLVTPSGKKEVRHWPTLQNLKGGGGGLAQDGEDTLAFNYKAKVFPGVGMYQSFLFD